MKKDGGPAFPQARGGYVSKLDYFAAAVMAGGLEQGVEDNMNISFWHEPRKLAKRAYDIAEAMLAESERRSK